MNVKDKEMNRLKQNPSAATWNAVVSVRKNCKMSVDQAKSPDTMKKNRSY